MARGSIRRHERPGSIRYEVVVDLPIDPVTGKRRQRSKSFRTKREASVQLNAWQVEIDKGTAVDRSKQTVAEMMLYWLETYARFQVRPKSYEDYESTIRNHIIPALGYVPIQKLTPDMVQLYYSQLMDRGCGARTILYAHQRLSQALDQALKMGLVSRNVTDLVKPPRIERKEMHTWTAYEAQKFMRTAKDCVYGPIWIVALTTGMRRGELLGLRWQDIDFDRKVLHVRQTVGVLHGKTEIKPPKTNSSRREVPVPAEVLKALREHRVKQNQCRLSLGEAWQDYDLVFASKVGTPIHPTNLTYNYERLVAKAGVPKIRIHDHRHTHVTLAIQAGANLKAVSKRVGHATTAITMDIYAHVLPEQHTEVADKIGAVLFRTDLEAEQAM
jgi:integrase